MGNYMAGEFWEGNGCSVLPRNSAAYSIENTFNAIVRRSVLLGDAPREKFMIPFGLPYNFDKPLQARSELADRRKNDGVEALYIISIKQHKAKGKIVCKIETGVVQKEVTAMDNPHRFLH